MLNQILSTVTYNVSGSTTNVSGDIIAAVMGALTAMMLPILALVIVVVIGQWKMFEKAGYEGWKAIIPFYNMYILTEISGQNGWLFLINFIPLVGTFIWTIMVSIKLAPAFGKDMGFAIGLILLSPIFYCILGFGKAEYTLGKGASAANTDASAPTPTPTPSEEPKADAPQA